MELLQCDKLVDEEEGRPGVCLRGDLRCGRVYLRVTALVSDRLVCGDYFRRAHDEVGRDG